MREKLTHALDPINYFLKKHAHTIFKVVVGAMLSLACIVSVMLIYEYRFFKRETEKMLVYKENYNNYVIAVKKILHNYNKAKARLEELETLVVEKKNEFEDLENSAGQTVFPEGVRVYSTDDDEDEATAPFLIVNRELEYLKQSTLDYLQAEKLSYLQSRISPNAWRDYTDQLSDQHKAKSGKKHARRAKRVSTKKRKKVYAESTSQAITPKSKKRIHDITMSWPINRSSFWMSSPFGPRKKADGSAGFHTGIDMAAPKNTAVKAAASGVVVEARYTPGYGNTVVIAHTGKYRTRYAHLNSFGVDVGQRVEQGECIGKVGATGHVRSKRRGGDASHLHFEVHAFGKHVNPIYFLG